MPHDVVILGGGHNGLTAAAYLARAGRSVLLLERDDHLGGAAVSAQAFEGVDARLSRYSYLVSLLPQRIIDDLGLDVRLVRRRYSSYTPDPDRPRRVGCSSTTRPGAEASAAAFARVDAAGDQAAWTAFYADTARLAERLFPTLTEPLPTRAEARALVGDDAIWRAVHRPAPRRDHRRPLRERPRTRRRRDRRPDRHVHRPRRSRRSTRTAASCTTSSAAAPATGMSRSGAWAR